MELSDFFFLRPYWLFLAIPAAWLVWLALRRAPAGAAGAWSRLVDPHLLAVLSVGEKGGKRSRRLPLALGVGLAAATLAMAGPTWQRIPQPSFQPRPPVVVALSLAQSMNADDVSPSRLARAGHKLRDILDRQEGSDVGLVIYSDRPFAAAPLTDDGEVIREMLPELSTELMPVLGDNAGLAIAEAAALLENAGAAGGRIVLLTDSAGADPTATIAAAKAALARGYGVDVIGIGTAQGTTMRTAAGRTITGKDGAPMRTELDEAQLRQVARAGGGLYSPLMPDDSDVARLLPDRPRNQSAAGEPEFKADGWADMGYWLLLVPVLLAPLAFRRNVLLVLPAAIAIAAGLPAGKADAADLSGLWQTPDQQGAAAFAGQDFSAAAGKFEDRRWRAAAQYRAGDYANAASELAGGAGADDAYNRGNALARSGDLEGALEAYDKSLETRPDDADVRFNRDLVARLLEQQQQQQQQQAQQEQQQGGQGQDPQQAEQQQQQGGQGQETQQAEQQQQGGQGQDPQQAEQQQQQGGQGQETQQAEQQQQGGQGQETQQAEQQQGGQGQETQQAEQQQQGEQQQGGQGQEKQQAEQQQKAAPARSGADAAEEERSAFRKAMDAMLKGNGEASERRQPEPSAEAEAAASSGGITEQEQANEQLLRRVPDDASGLLRARIRQHYGRYL